MKNQRVSKGVLVRGAEACAVVLSCVALSACGAADDELGDAAEVGSAENLGEVQQPLVNDGFWQVADGAAVYWLHGSSICWVRDQGMLMALRWTTTPQWTTSNYSLAQLRSGRSDQGACHYPDYKMLKTYDSDWVYRTGASQFCHVKNQTQLAQFGGWSKVLIMQRPRQKADYSEGGGVGAEGVWNSWGERGYVGDCRDPVAP